MAGRQTIFGLTPRQAECFAQIVVLTRGSVPPSVRALADALGVSPSNAHGFLHILRERGYITFLDGQAQSLRVIAAPPASVWSRLDVLQLETALAEIHEALADRRAAA